MAPHFQIRPTTLPLTRMVGVGVLSIFLLLVACAAPQAPVAPAEGAPTEAVAEVAATAAPAETTEAVTTTTDTATDAAALFPLTISDATGQEFTFDSPPRLGCSWYGCIETMADMGIPLYATILPPENAAKIFYSPAGEPTHLIADSANPELWAAAEIDVLLTRVPPSDDQAALKEAAPIFYLHHPSYGESAQTGYQAYIENARILGQLTGQPEAAEASIARFETVLSNLRALSTPETAALTVAVLFQGEGYRFVAPGNPFCAVLTEVGLGNCVGEGAASTETNAEEFLSLNPDWIVYQAGDGKFADRTDPVWSQLSAVQSGQVYDALGNRYYCCSLRGLTHALQEYVHYVVPAANIPLPVTQLDFDPAQSPLVVAQ